jgi:hypothetical protein
MSSNQDLDTSAAGKLDPVEMNEMIAYYANNIAPVLTKLKKTNFPDIDPNIPDATSAWMSVAEIEKFIADNKATGNANGVRIYYGVHTKDSFPGDATKNQKGLHNIIFVPTSSGSQPPTYLNSKNMVDVKPSDGYNAYNVQEGDTNNTGYALDHSALCPPYCQIV